VSLALAGILPAQAQSALLSGSHVTMRSLRWEGVTRQKFDYSCGTGSIANLLVACGEKPIDERDLVLRYAKLRSRAEVQEAMKEGFSLLDLKNMLAMLGYDSEGVRYEAGTLPDELRPMIVYLVVKGYRHFAVFAGVDRGQIILLDPARGKIRVSVARFLSEWDGSALALQGRLRPGSFFTGTGELTNAQEAARSAALHR
jgi:hypothetical protein